VRSLRRRPRSAALLRLAYRGAYRVLRVWSAVARPRTRGVKCVLLDGARRALFVRHTYGARGSWELPGGGARRGERALDAARREAREELGIDAAAWELLGVAQGVWHGKHERLDVFAVAWRGEPLRLDPVEIACAAWFPLDAPPAPLGPSTRMALTTFGR
jgi:8-oxo-dGTP diphosphatase